MTATPHTAPVEPASVPLMRVEHRGGDKFDINVRGHVVRVDQPVKDRGEHTAPTPTELLIASLASCVAFYARRYLARHDLPTEGLAVEATFDMGSKPARVAGSTCASSSQRACRPTAWTHCWPSPPTALCTTPWPPSPMFRSRWRMPLRANQIGSSPAVLRGDRPSHGLCLPPHCAASSPSPSCRSMRSKPARYWCWLFSGGVLLRLALPARHAAGNGAQSRARCHRPDTTATPTAPQAGAGARHRALTPDRRSLRGGRWLVLAWAILGAAVSGTIVFRVADPWIALLMAAQIELSPASTRPEVCT